MANIKVRTPSDVTELNWSDMKWQMGKQ